MIQYNLYRSVGTTDRGPYSRTRAKLIFLRLPCYENRNSARLLPSMGVATIRNLARTRIWVRRSFTSLLASVSRGNLEKDSDFCKELYLVEPFCCSKKQMSKSLSLTLLDGIPEGRCTNCRISHTLADPKLRRLYWLLNRLTAIMTDDCPT